MKQFCESLRKHAIKIIDFKKKKMKLLTNGQQTSYENAKICIDKIYRKFRDYGHYAGE